MIVDTTESNKKLCPMHPGSSCKGPECMAWKHLVTDDPSDPYTGNGLADSRPRKKIAHTDKGFCGLVYK